PRVWELPVPDPRGRPRQPQHSRSQAHPIPFPVCRSWSSGDYVITYLMWAPPAQDQVVGRSGVRMASGTTARQRAWAWGHDRAVIMTPGPRFLRSGSLRSGSFADGPRSVDRMITFLPDIVRRRCGTVTADTNYAPRGDLRHRGQNQYVVGHNKMCGR